MCLSRWLLFTVCLQDLGVAGSFLMLGLRCQAFELWLSGKRAATVSLRDAETEAAAVRVPPLKALRSLAGGLSAAANTSETAAACSSGTPFPFALILPQATTSQILEGKLKELGHKVLLAAAEVAATVMLVVVVLLLLLLLLLMRPSVLALLAAAPLRGDCCC